VAGTKFVGAIFEQADKRAVDVSEAEEAEVMGADRASPGPKPLFPGCLDAALKRHFFHVTPCERDLCSAFLPP